MQPFGIRAAALIVIVASPIGVSSRTAGASVLALPNVVAYSGNQIPGQAVGVTYGTISNNPSISAGGQVVFGCAINGVAAVNNQGAFSGTSAASVVMVAQSGTQAPGGPAGATMDLSGASSGFQTSTVKVNGAGVISFVSLMTGGGVVAGSNNWGVFSGTTGGPFSMLARSGSQVPGAAPGTLTGNSFSTSVGSLPVNGSNLLYFGATTTGGDTVAGTNNSVILGSNSGSLFTVIRQGDAAPGTGGGIFGSMSNPSPVVANASGQLLFGNTLVNSGSVTSANDGVLYLYTPGSGLSLFHREGSSAPGTAGAVFSGSAQMFNGTFNNAGQAILGSTLSGGDVVGTTNNSAVYVASSSGETLAWRNGNAAPGVPGGTFLATNGFGYNLSNTGNITIPASMVQSGPITAANDAGIWWGTPGALALLAREGDAIPSLNATFGNGLATATTFINALDQIVFTNAMTSGDSALNGKTVLMAYDPGQGLFPIAYAGETLEVSPGVFKTISSFSLSRPMNTDGASFALSDTGLLALRVGFTDSTSAIVTYTVPAPISLAMLSIGGGLLAVRRRR